MKKVNQMYRPEAVLFVLEDFTTWAFKFFQSPSKMYKEGSQDKKAIDLKCVELRMNAINEEIGKLNTFDAPEEESQEEEEINQTEQLGGDQQEDSEQTENLESNITASSEELSEENQAQEEQTDALDTEDSDDVNPEDVEAVLNIINSVA